MFASRVPEYQTDDQLGTDRTPAEDNFRPDHPLYETIAGLADLTARHPALRNGAEQVRYASQGAGIFAFSRLDRRQQREYVVALNNSTTEQSAAIPTYLAEGGFTLVHGQGADHLTSTDDRRLQVTVPALSAVVYEADRTIPVSPRAPGISLSRPVPSSVSHGRMALVASVGGASFNEVTFQAWSGGRWHSIGTDDSAPYRVFHDTSNLRTGTKLAYRAIVLDNAGHTRVSQVRPTRVPSPAISVTAPADGGTVTRIDPVRVTATVDPERATQSVLFQRSVSGGAWTDLGTDTSSPVYTVTDDVRDLPLGTSVSYRATLIEPGSPRVTSRPVTVTTANPQPARDHVTLVGDLQSEVGCAGDWNPACPESRLAFDTGDGQWHGTFTLPAGSYSWKVAINDSWTENYGAGGAAGGDNLSLVVPPSGGRYAFTWNQVTHVPSVAPAP